MEMTRWVLQTRSFSVRPRGAGPGYTVEVKNSSGASLATCDRDGTLRDQTKVLLGARLRWHGRGLRATDLGIEITDETGRLLAAGRVVGYGFGPGTRKITVAVVDAVGQSLARLEPRDRRGQHLALHVAGADVATITATQIRSGFLRASRVYAVQTADTIPDELRPVLLALCMQYDAMLGAAQAVEQPD